MAHSITNTDTLILANKPAWHGLGTVLPSTFTADDALSAGYLNWDVHLVPLTTVPLVGGANDGARIAIPDKRAVVRSDNGTVIGVVGDRYTPVQNREVFEMIRDGIDRIAGNLTPVQIESCGSFKGGAITFTCVHTHQFEVGKGDPIRTYAMFGNSHDGSSAFSCLNTSVRTVCNNTYNMGIAEASRAGTLQRVRHTRSIHLKVEQIMRELVRGVEAAQQFEVEAIRLANRKPSMSKVQEIYERIYIEAIGKPDDDRAKRKAQATVSDWSVRLTNSRNALGNGTDGSLWAIFNSVTEWADHERTVRGDSTDRRLHANIYGDAADLKSKVWDTVQELSMAL